MSVELLWRFAVGFLLLYLWQRSRKLEKEIDACWRIVQHLQGVQIKEWFKRRRLEDR